MTARKNNSMTKCYIFLMVLLYVFSLCSLRSIAAEAIDIHADVALTIQYIKEEKQINGALFQIYHVADLTESGGYVIKKDFESYPISFREMDQEKWQQYALTFEGYVRKDNIKAFDGGETDKNGQLVFPSDGVKMRPGLYLVIGQRREIGRYTYHTSPFFVQLPGEDIASGGYAYNVSVVPKSWYDVDEPELNITKRKVLKVWDDARHEMHRPESVTVHLMRGDKVHDTVILSEKNNWRHTWSNLSKNYDWSLVEEDVDNYKVHIVREGVTFVVTNTFSPDRPGIPETEPYNPPESPKSPGGDTPNGGNIPLGVLGEYSVRDILPQTGQLWWPIPILACCGVLCIVVGVIRHRGAYEEE